ncbi:MAG: PfkB domain protein [Rariglobus sp.]|jgi:sugar/nucleoside kinase (ribokinase family)|nr:PfkB domain protein [Rariglobus sp.]
MSLSSPRSGLLAGGNWIVDHVKILDGWPPQDALANIRSESWGNGGSPYNILKGLAKLGADFPLAGIGLVGDDPDGQRILADCRDHRIDTAQLRQTSAAPTSYSDVMTDGTTGRRTFFHQRGANALLAPEHFDFTLTRARIFHLGYILLLDGLDVLENGEPRACGVLRRARAAGLLTSLDCVSENSGRFHAVVKPALPEVDILFVNDFEAEKLTGVPLRPAPDQPIRRAAVEAAARALIVLGVRRWVIVHFPEAVYALHAAGAGHWQPSLNVPSSAIKGTAGAGDAFACGVLHGFHAGWEIADTLRLGVCAAASSLSDATCSEGILSAARCLQLGGQWGFRTTPA